MIFWWWTVPVPRPVPPRPVPDGSTDGSMAGSGRFRTVPRTVPDGSGRFLTVHVRPVPQFPCPLAPPPCQERRSTVAVTYLLTVPVFWVYCDFFINWR